MKKLKTLFLSTLPFFVGLGIQTIAVYYLLFIAAVFLFYISPSFLGISYKLDHLIEITADINFNTLISIVFAVCCIVTFALWYYRSYEGKFKINLKKDFHGYEILGIILLVPGAQFMSSILTGIISMIFPSWLEEYMELIENVGLTGEIPLLMMLYSVILAPISEELIFRGVTYRIARKAFPFWVANCIQALLFGVFHMNPLQGCYTFVLGLFMGYICEKGGTLYHAIFFHFLFNLWGTTASEVLSLLSEELQTLIIIIGTIGGLTAGFYFFRKGNKLKQNTI